MPDYFPVTHSILSADALRAYVSAEYDVGTPSTCICLSLGQNDTYRVTTAEGKRYILRVYRSGWRSLSDIRYELDVLLHLAREGIAVSVPLPRKDDRLVQAVSVPEGTRYVVLFTYAPGHQPAYGPEAADEVFQYGRHVARIHTATDTFTSQHDRFALDLEHLLDLPLRSLQPFLSHRIDDWTYLQSLAERLKHQIEKLEADPLERGFCHGDFNGSNVHVTPGNTWTFFDFDCCGPGWRAYDMAVFRLGVRQQGGEERGWKMFLRGYTEVRPFRENDLRATAFFVAIRKIWLLGLHAMNGHSWGFNWMNDGYYDRALTFLREWETSLEASLVEIE